MLEPRRIGLLSGATLPGGAVVDVAIADGIVTTVGAPGTVPAGPGDALDLTGFVLLPAPAEPHAHLDKALTCDLIDPPTGDLRRAIDSFRSFAAVETEAGIRDRATAALTRMLASGTTAVRTHVNFFSPADPLVAVRALVAVREAFAGVLHLELVALPGFDTATALIEEALDAGLDLVGGAPHLAPDPAAELDRLLEIAERRGVGIDLHTDEGLDGPVTLAAFADRTRGWPQVRSAGHCVRLGTLPAAEAATVVDAVRASDVGIITLPITNLYLQGREHPVATPRGLTAVRALLDAGVRVAAGADNLRDPFNPVGRGDALETASLLVTAGHLGLEEAIDAVTVTARSVLGLPAAGPVAGRAADLLAVRGDTLGDVVAFASPDRVVLHAGRIVSRTTALVESAAPIAVREVVR